MIVRTTHKIIIDEIGETINALEFTKCVDESTSLQKEWVCLSDLKKEIKERIHYKGLNNNDQFNEGYVYALEMLHLKLCNSSEQNAGNLWKAHKHDDSGNSVRSVSGEHNTGGDNEEFTNAYTEFSPVQNPKKCTCKEPVEIWDTKVCNRCGGVL